MSRAMELESRYAAHNYAPLPVVLVRGDGVYVWDDEGRRYIDMMGAYSAVSHGHRHPRLVRALCDQADRLGVVSRAFYTDRLGPFLERACMLTGQDRALAMNTGTEAVETALKAARKWAYKIKGVPEGGAEIIVCAGNFHGRSIAISGFSSDAENRDGFGPFPAGFVVIPYADAQALAAAITPRTAAFLVEPIQGEGGIIVPPAGYLSACAEICRSNDVLMICDEIQTGLGRTGKLLACEHDRVKPDAVTLGKALGGGLVPVSLFLAREGVMDVFEPGQHGSTFGGYPIAAAVGLEALDVLMQEELAERSGELGDYMMMRLRDLRSPLIRDLRGKGLFIGMELDGAAITARQFCECLLAEGVLTKDTHRDVVRFAPPLVITRDQVDAAVEHIQAAFDSFAANSAGTDPRHAAAIPGE